MSGSRTLTRRAVLAGAAALAVPRTLRAQTKLTTGDPFTLGVASGCPTARGVVLWTRLAPDPLAGGGMPPQPVEVRWELAGDEQFRKIAKRGSVRALPEHAHSVHVEVNGLEPDRWYWFRFHAAGAVSPVGRTRTFPAPAATPARLRLAFGSCQHFEHGWYAAHRHLLAEELDVMFFLGDYIYELSWGASPVRKHAGAAIAVTLEDYRTRYAQYRTDPDLQRLHGHVPWLVTWDDHEVANDYAALVPQFAEADFAARRAAAYQAFWEHMPLRMDQRPVKGTMRLHDRYTFGRLAELTVLDGRQYRDRQACPPQGHAGGGNTVRECAELARAERSFLGKAQEKWLEEGLARTPSAWNVLAQQTLVAQVDRRPGPGGAWATDPWDGYPGARRRLLEQLARVSNPVILGGDIHQHIVADLRVDFDRPETPVVATELVCTSITSQSASQAHVDQLRPENPHIKLMRADKRGYVTLELTGKRAIATLRAIDDPTRKDAALSTMATFAIEAGKPGAVPA